MLGKGGTVAAFRSLRFTAWHLGLGALDLTKVRG